ncbi:putative rho guanine nucleotide exchange factor gef2 [Golovinomyces cichoracearum]|uniref:Putative rho guanine nucleotide exchange factor gef2 n=1 Tax=Golovinomyces cichoracearum TaxID=62708 RepID=A0A420IC69_9PEZI|nr:putative rho guanine nucleotide exchange factor gef2 [Golovinomyces cichoracearum]
MVRITDELDLSQDDLTLYHTTDGHLGNSPVLIFHGPSIISNSTQNSSRIQVHIFTIAGFQSYRRITISPNSPFYQSVDYLPREKQGDEICRGIAFGLLKYLKELPDTVKSTLKSQVTNPRGKQSFSVLSLFSEQHAAILASSMVKAENTVEVLLDILTALCPYNMNHVDIDLILPSKSIKSIDENAEIVDDTLDSDINRYGDYAPLVKLFGNVTFIPSSKLRRAPSRASSTNRSRSFSKDQKISLRREMGELVDTEERYVIKMYELVHNIANEFLEKAKNRRPGSFSPSEEDLENLFPKSLYKILQVNTAFLNAVQKIMDESEENAMFDLEAPAVTSTSSRSGINKQPQDPTGALSFAMSLLEWFPQFSDCYRDYIRASQLFPQTITSFIKQQSSFSKRVQVTGEQQLRSAVIEPVQRLPRYSLFIDNIVSCLPVLHPALQPFLKARDIITSICSMDPSGTENSQLFKRLGNLIDLWPTDLVFQGRLITAVDYIELASPFHKIPDSNSRKGIFLIFSDKIVLLNKSHRCSLSAKGFLAEIEKPSASSMMATMTATASGNKRTYDLSFSSWYKLCEACFTTSDDCRFVYLISEHEPVENTKNRDKSVTNFPIRVFILQGSYENKGIKFTEEITKARIEGRFSEEDRESCQWSLRSVKLASTDLTIHTAIYEETADYLTKNRIGPATLRVLVDHSINTKGVDSSHQDCEVNASITTITSGTKYRFEIAGHNQKNFANDLVTDQLLPALVVKILDLVRSHYSLRDLVPTKPYTSFYIKMLKSLQIHDEREKYRSFMPSSPVKLLTNLFNTTPSISGNKNPKTSSRINFLSLTRSDSNKSKISNLEPDTSANVQSDNSERPDNHLIRLEETFSAYTTAIHSRKGNVIGRTLRNYATTDELAVNAIYNTFIENPYDQRAASEVTIDILFAAFEKYLRMAWKEQMGDVISLQTLDELQLQALRLASGDFSHYVRLILSEMTPQNRRAFISIVKLLADLLDGCGNDGDRGTITAAFAELLVINGNPHDYINLLDRLILDQEKLFQFLETSAVDGAGTNVLTASISGNKPNSSAVGSIASNTSSFRKRFAETVLRQNTSSEKPSVWRSLGKNSRNITCGDQTHTNSSLFRSRSIESQFRRPNPRERPTIIDAFEQRPSSSSGPTAILHLNGNSHSGEKTYSKPAKKKRRSSLSDLKNHYNEVSLDLSKISDAPEGHQSSLKVSSSTSFTSSPSKIPLSSASPERSRNSIYKTGSPTQKENLNLSLPIQKKKKFPVEYSSMMASTSTPSNSDAVLIKDLWTTPSLKKSLSLSQTNIPSLSNQSSTTCAKRASRPPTSHSNAPRSPQKLRLPSPQKLRERIHVEAKAIREADSNIHSEISKISAQMARLHTTEKSSYNQQISQPPSLLNIQSSLSLLASRIPDIIADLTARNEAIELDLERSLQALEFKLKGLDQLYLEATAENELLYERFNGELARIVKAVKGKAEDSIGSSSMRNERFDRGDLVDKIRQSTEETAIIRSENARLKRELLSLKALLKVCE